jgi:hypothetical protein
LLFLGFNVVGVFSPRSLMRLVILGLTSSASFLWADQVLTFFLLEDLPMKRKPPTDRFFSLWDGRLVSLCLLEAGVKEASKNSRYIIYLRLYTDCWLDSLNDSTSLPCGRNRLVQRESRHSGGPIIGPQTVSISFIEALNRNPSTGRNKWIPEPL